MTPPPLAAAGGADEYLAFCDGVRSLCTVDLSQYKRGQMERRIRSFASRRGVSQLAAYLGLLRRDAGELESFLDRITINVSQLWRNPEQWTVIGRDILPELAAAGRIRAWSAGCSYGAEAYTLAAVAREVVPTARFEVLGTDIDARMVERARAGRFSAEDGRSAPADALRRWFTPIDGGWQARAELRAAARFELGDLLRLRPRRGTYDLVLCRNTVIYFEEPVRDALHGRLADSLRSGGYLVVGSTERVSDPAGLGLSSPRPFVYRKI
jgi:chemotaxis protein methyltransferase CheR